MFTSHVILLLIAIVFMVISSLLKRKGGAKFTSNFTAVVDFVVVSASMFAAFILITENPAAYLIAFIAFVSAFATVLTNDDGGYKVCSIIFYIAAIISIIISL